MRLLVARLEVNRRHRGPYAQPAIFKKLEVKEKKPRHPPGLSCLTRNLVDAVILEPSAPNAHE
jgi:hypothetical protein